jgi:hypothetical protein
MKEYWMQKGNGFSRSLFLEITSFIRGSDESFPAKSIIVEEKHHLFFSSELLRRVKFFLRFTLYDYYCIIECSVLTSKSLSSSISFFIAIKQSVSVFSNSSQLVIIKVGWLVGWVKF